MGEFFYSESSKYGSFAPYVVYLKADISKTYPLYVPCTEFKKLSGSGCGTVYALTDWGTWKLLSLERYDINNCFPVLSFDNTVVDLENKLRIFKADSLALFYSKDVYPISKGGCENFVNCPLLLKPETMTRLEIEHKLIYQVVIPELSPGLFKINPCGFIDCYLFADHKRIYTVYRNEVYGVLTPAAVKRYDSYFRLNLAKFCKTLKGGG